MQTFSSLEALTPAQRALSGRPSLKRPHLPPFDVLMKRDLAMHYRRGGGSGRNNLLRDLGKRARYIQSVHQEAFLPTWREHQARSYKRNFPAVFGLDYLVEWWLDGDLWVGQYVRPERQEAAAKPFFLVLPVAYLNEGGEDLIARDFEAKDFRHVDAVVACFDKLKRPLRSLRIPDTFAFPPGYVNALEKRKARASESKPLATEAGAAPAPVWALGAAVA